MAEQKQKLKMPPIEQLRGRQLGRILIKMGRIRRADVLEALEIQKQRGGPLGSILVELGHVNDEELNLALAAQVPVLLNVRVYVSTAPGETVSLSTDLLEPEPRTGVSAMNTSANWDVPLTASVAVAVR